MFHDEWSLLSGQDAAILMIEQCCYYCFTTWNKAVHRTWSKVIIELEHDFEGCLHCHGWVK